MVAAEVRRAWPQYLGSAWEQIARDSVARLLIAGHRWRPAQHWWGAATDREQLELDVVAECSDDSRRVLVGEVKIAATAREVRAIADRLARDAARCPELAGRKVELAVWVLRGPVRVPGVTVITAEDVVRRPARVRTRVRRR